MKAMVYREYGSADVLRYEEIETPTIADDEVLVRVRAASLNFADRAALHGIPGLIRLAFGLRRPKATVLGRDIAGTVEAVGSAVTRFRVGDAVFGEVEQRGFAEYVAAKESYLAGKPAGITFEQAATLPVAGTTALQAMRLGAVGPGRTVLVNGATGGVGPFAVQLAKTLGAEVTGVCRTRNVDFVRGLGADHVVDRTRTDVTTGGRRFDVILDLTGDHPVSRFRRILTRNGIFIASSGTGGRLLGPIPRLMTTLILSPFVSQRLRGLIVRRDIDDLTHLAELVATGRLAPAIERTYPLAETADALRFIESEHPRGKIVLTV
jgi:NADPH:quinone reductase-like Zn-dependent oxidoreductase